MTHITTDVQSQDVLQVDHRTKTRVRLPGPKKVLQRTLQRLEKLVQASEAGDQTLKPSMLVQCLLEESRIAHTLLRDQQAEKKRRDAVKTGLSAEAMVERPELDDPQVQAMVKAWSE